MTDSLHHRGPDDEGYVYINLREGRGRAYAGEKTLWLPFSYPLLTEMRANL